MTDVTQPVVVVEQPMPKYVITVVRHPTDEITVPFVRIEQNTSIGHCRWIDLDIERMQALVEALASIRVAHLDRFPR